MGVGLGAALLPGIAQHIIVARGWRSAFATFGGMALVIGLPAAWLATRNASGPVARSSRVAAAPVGPLLRTRTFLLICAIFFLLSTVVTGILTHFVPLLTDRGVPGALATKIVGLTGISTLISRGVMGWLLDRVRALSVVAVVALLGAATCLILVYGGGFAVYATAACLLGFIVGAEIDFIGFLVRHYFGAAAFGRLYAVAFAAAALGPGAAIIGYTFDRYHTYGPGLIVFVCLAVAAAALTFAMPPAPASLALPPEGASGGEYISKKAASATGL